VLPPSTIGGFIFDFHRIVINDAVGAFFAGQLADKFGHRILLSLSSL